MNVVLYSTNCPMCRILESKLKSKNVDFALITDVELMESLGFLSAPVLTIDGKPYNYGDAVRWVNSLKKGE